MCTGTNINTKINTHIHTCAHIHTSDNPKSLEKCAAAQLNSTLSTALPTYTTMGKLPLSLVKREEEAKDKGEREGSSKDSCPCKPGYLFLTIAKSPVTFHRV